MVRLSVPVHVWVERCVMFITTPKHRTDVPNGKYSESVHVSVEGEQKLGSIILTSVYYKHPSVMPHTISCSHFRLVSYSFPLSFTNTHSLPEGWSPGRRSLTEKDLKKKFSVFMSLFSSDIEQPFKNSAVLKNVMWKKNLKKKADMSPWTVTFLNQK